MNKEYINEIRKQIHLLHEKHIYLYELNIIDELDSQLMDTIPDEEYQKLYNEIEYTYLKVDGVALENIVRCAIDNKNKIVNNDDTFRLREECCWYE